MFIIFKKNIILLSMNRIIFYFNEILLYIDMNTGDTPNPHNLINWILFISITLIIEIRTTPIVFINDTIQFSIPPMTK